MGIRTSRKPSSSSRSRSPTARPTRSNCRPMTWWVTWPTPRASSTSRRRSTVSPGVSPCGPLRCIAGRAASGRSRIGTPTPWPITPPLPRAVADDAIEAAWGEVFDALPAGWSAGRPSYYPERREWQQYAFDSFEMPKVGVRSKEWTAISATRSSALGWRAGALPAGAPARAECRAGTAGGAL